MPLRLPVRLGGLAAVALAAAGAGDAHAFAPATCAPDNVANGACFGLEPTFTNDDILGQARGGPAARAALDAWRAAVPDACGHLPGGTTCRIERLVPNEGWDDKCRADRRGADSDEIEDGAKFRVCIYPVGDDRPWYYQVEYDYGCVELNTRPSNLAWLSAMAAGGGVMDTMIFGVAGTAGLGVDAVTGAGHVHIDVESGFASALKLLNFMTGIHNLRLLPLMPNLGATGLNAPPLAALGTAARARYWQFVQDNNDYAGNLVTLTRMLKEQVYVDTYNDRRLRNIAHDRDLLTARFGAYLGEDFEYDEDWPIPVQLGQVSQELRDFLNQIPAGDRIRWTHYRSGDDDDSIGLGWAQKGQHIRMADPYGTIEIRNIAPQQTAQHIVDIVTLLSGAMAAAPDDQVVLLQDGLALDQTDGDGPRAWLVPEGGLFPYKRFRLPNAALSQVEAADIFARFRAWANDDVRVCRLTRYMPGRVRVVGEAFCNPPDPQD